MAQRLVHAGQVVPEQRSTSVADPDPILLGLTDPTDQDSKNQAKSSRGIYYTLRSSPPPPNLQHIIFFPDDRRRDGRGEAFTLTSTFLSF